MFVAISLLLLAVCLLPAAGKLLGHPRMRHAAAHFGIPWPRYRLIGVAELAAAAGVLTGLWWHPLGLAAAAGMAGDCGRRGHLGFGGLSIADRRGLSDHVLRVPDRLLCAVGRRRGKSVRRKLRLLPWRAGAWRWTGGGILPASAMR